MVWLCHAFPAGSRRGAETVAIAGFLDACRSSNTRAAYGADLAHVAAWCRSRGTLDLLTLDVDDVARYRTACEVAGASPATVARRISTISSFAVAAARAARSVPTRRSRARPSNPRAPRRCSVTSTPGHCSPRPTASSRRSALLIRLLMLDGLKVGDVIRADAVGCARPAARRDAPDARPEGRGRSTCTPATGSAVLPLSRPAPRRTVVAERAARPGAVAVDPLRSRLPREAGRTGGGARAGRLGEHAAASVRHGGARRRHRPRDDSAEHRPCRSAHHPSLPRWGRTARRVVDVPTSGRGQRTNFRPVSGKERVLAAWRSERVEQTGTANLEAKGLCNDKYRNR